MGIHSYNRLEMLTRIAAILEERCLATGERPMLLGLSGGPDSLCLWRLLKELSYPVVVAHFNHGLRTEAAQEAAYVEGLARGAGQAFHLGSGDTVEYARQEHISIEEAARELRYRFLFTVARQVGAQAVIVGHQADDQVETVLMHLLRGAGASGLTGMRFRALPNPWSETIPLLRPLLSTWRAEIEAYLAEQQLQPVRDASNQENTYFRNRLRNELIPLLKSYNPQAHLALWRMADVLAAEDDALGIFEQDAWDQALAATGPGYVGFHRRAFLAQPLGMQRRLLKRGLHSLRGDLRDVDFSHLERALAGLAMTTGSRTEDLAGGIQLVVDGEAWLWLRAGYPELPTFDYPQLRDPHPQTLVIPGEAILAGSWRLRAEWLEGNADIYAGARGNADPSQAWLDAATFTQPVSLRGRLPGERFQPLGMQGRMVGLADFMVNQKIPSRLRAAWPLVCSPEGVMWVSARRIDQRFRVRESSHRVLHLHLYRYE